jgi:hypothetical protein
LVYFHGFGTIFQGKSGNPVAEPHKIEAKSISCRQEVFHTAAVTHFYNKWKKQEKKISGLFGSIKLIRTPSKKTIHGMMPFAGECKHLIIVMSERAL